MYVLCVVSILRLYAIAVIVLRNQICTTQIAICFIEIVIYYIGNNLLTAIPDMINGLTINSLFNTQTTYVIRIACSNIAISKTNQLIQTIISVCFGLFRCCLGNLVTICIIGVNRFLSLRATGYSVQKFCRIICKCVYRSCLCFALNSLLDLKVNKTDSSFVQSTINYLLGKIFSTLRRRNNC